MFGGKFKPDKEKDYVCSMSWTSNTKYLAVGSKNATIQLWDNNGYDGLQLKMNNVMQPG